MSSRVPGPQSIESIGGGFGRPRSLTLKGVGLVPSVALILILIPLSFLKIYSIPVGTFLVAVTAAILFRTLILNKPTPTESILTTGNFWFLVGFFLVFVVTPFFLVISPDGLPLVFAERQWREFFWQTQLYAAIALQSVTTGVILSVLSSVNPKKHKSISLALPNSSYKYSMFPSLVICFLASLTYVFYLVSTGDPFTALLGTRRQRINFAIDSGGYLADSYLIIVGVLSFWLIRFRIARDKFRSRVTVVFLILLMLPSAFQGSRSFFFYFATVMIIIFVMTGGRFDKRYVVLMAIILPLALNAPRDFRESESVKLTQSAFSYYSLDSLKTFLAVGDSSMAPTFSILLSEMGNSVNYTYGSTYALALLKPIPRDIFPNKPIEFDNLLNQKIFPEYSKYVGFSFSALSEPYVNFGLFGIVVFFVILGYVSTYFNRRATSGTDRSILINAWVAAFMFILARGNLTTDIHRLLFPLLIALLVVKLSRRKIDQAIY